MSLLEIVIFLMFVALCLIGFLGYGMMGALGEAEVRLSRIERHLGLRTLFPGRPLTTDAEWNELGVVFPDQTNYVPREQPLKKG